MQDFQKPATRYEFMFAIAAKWPLTEAGKSLYETPRVLPYFGFALCMWCMMSSIGVNGIFTWGRNEAFETMIAPIM
jgi:hypothetical protein